MIRETRLVRLSPQHAIALREIGLTLNSFATDPGEYQVRDRRRAECLAVARELRHLQRYLHGMAIHMLAGLHEPADARRERLVPLCRRRSEELGRMAKEFEREAADERCAPGEMAG